MRRSFVLFPFFFRYYGFVRFFRLLVRFFNVDGNRRLGVFRFCFFLIGNIDRFRRFFRYFFSIFFVRRVGAFFVFIIDGFAFGAFDIFGIADLFGIFIRGFARLVVRFGSFAVLFGCDIGVCVFFFLLLRLLFFGFLRFFVLLARQNYIYREHRQYQHQKGGTHNIVPRVVRIREYVVRRR